MRGASMYHVLHVSRFSYFAAELVHAYSTLRPCAVSIQSVLYCPLRVDGKLSTLVARNDRAQLMARSRNTASIPQTHPTHCRLLKYTTYLNYLWDITPRAVAS